ncbi:uncharacterized protein LOC130725626 [Lotus japonicus]|uniref:uncharacterized protein LOC130725626 n=1 Tax=Lotus japonicus TaxID=34305 RepID=UPI0025855E34|nr:uncharacterized protein LOC130725626 [Lotus japonicus]
MTATTIRCTRRRSNHENHTIGFDGNNKVTVTVTANCSVVRRWLKSMLYFHNHYFLRERLVVGLGVQWSAPSPDRPNPPADTLQLCIGRRCLIIQLSRAERVPQILRQFLKDPTITFVGFYNHRDQKKLKASRHQLEMCWKPEDLKIHAGTLHPDLVNAPVKEIVMSFLRCNVNPRREVSMSDWNREELTKDQLVYACVDAYCAFRIGKNLKVWECNYNWISKFLEF